MLFDRADLLEAFLGALYVDKGLDYCKKFCDVCFFPRLRDFIMRQDWNDPKSQLQQCCLTLRTLDGGEPDIPIYKVHATGMHVQVSCLKQRKWSQYLRFCVGRIKNLIYPCMLFKRIILRRCSVC